MEYELVIARINDYPRSDYFTRAVNDKIAQGYKPIGGIAISGGFYYQAMIKEENETTR